MLVEKRLYVAGPVARYRYRAWPRPWPCCQVQVQGLALALLPGTGTGRPGEIPNFRSEITWCKMRPPGTIVYKESGQILVLPAYRIRS